MARGVRVVLVGLGPIGQGIARLVLETPGLALVGACDISSEKAGQDLGKVLGLPRRLRVKVEADPLRLARHAIKVILTFTLLDRRSLPLAGMADYVERVGIYREFNARFFGMPPADFAEFVIAELERAGAVRRDGGLLRPANAAAG